MWEVESTLIMPLILSMLPEPFEFKVGMHKDRPRGAFATYYAYVHTGRGRSKNQSAPARGTRSVFLVYFKRTGASVWEGRRPVLCGNMHYNTQDQSSCNNLSAMREYGVDKS